MERTVTRMRLSEEIRTAFTTDAEFISFGEVMERVSQRSFGILLIIFAIPSALPVPAPGYSIPGGIALIALALQMIARREYPWLPQRVLEKRLPADPKMRMVNAMVKFIGFFERFVKPRLTFISRRRSFAMAMGGVVLCCGISMCIPIPLTNTAPALGVFFIGLGLLEEDALVALGGSVVAFLGLTITVSLLVLVLYVGLNPQDAADFVKEFIRSILGSGTEPELAG